jgi:hypothetical protein
MTTAGLIAIEDWATALGGAFNAGYFARYCLRTGRASGRRAGAAALALVGVAAILEALFSQVTLRAYEQNWSLEYGAWALGRAPLLAATLCVSAIVLRRLVSR